MRRFALLAIVAHFAHFSASGQKLVSHPLTSARSSLFAQSAGRTLLREFGSCKSSLDTGPENCLDRQDLSFILLDGNTGAVVASRWPDREKPIPLGSLIKPFTALAYGERHGYQYPNHTCRGTASGCWLPRGHGREGLTLAIANSCNSYFRILTADLTVEDMLPVASSYGLEPPPADASATDLRGMGSDWKISPSHMASAYLELIERANEPGVREVLAGMAASARQGTGREVGRALKHAAVLAKTGTAPCTHSPAAPGDGFVIAMLPADHPQILLMVRLHQAPGAQAAKIAGLMLGRIEP